MGRGRLEESVSFSTGTAGNVQALWVTVSDETGYEQLIERNGSNCSIACKCPSAPSAEALTPCRMFAVPFQPSVEHGKGRGESKIHLCRGADDAPHEEDDGQRG